MLSSLFRTQKFAGHGGDVVAVAFSPDSASVVTGAHRAQFLDTEPQLWLTSSGKRARKFKGHKVGVFSAAYSPDGCLVATGGGGVVRGRHWIYDHLIRVWNPQTGKQIRTFGDQLFFVNSLRFSPDSKFLLSGSNNCAPKAPVPDGFCCRLWDVESGSEVARFGHHSFPVKSVAFSKDGVLIATGSSPLGINHDQIQIKSFASDDPKASAEGAMNAQQIRKIVADGNIKPHYAAALKSMVERLPAGRLLSFTTHDAKRLEGPEGRTVRVWECASRREIGAVDYAEYVNAVAFSPKEQHLLSAGRELLLWEIPSGIVVRRFEKDPKLYTHCASYSPDGRLVATGTGGRNEISAPYESCFVWLWDAETGREIRRMPHKYPVLAVEFSPDGRHILAAGERGEVRLWDLSTSS